MAKQPSRSGKNIAALSWVALILLIPAVLYITHVTRQLHEVTQQNLRILGTAAERIEAVLKNAEDTAVSLVQDLGFACEFLRRQPQLALVASTCEDLEKEASPEKSKPTITTRFQAKDSDLQLWVSFSKAVGNKHEAINGTAAGPSGEAAGSGEMKPVPRNVENDERRHVTLRVDIDQVLDEIPFDGAFAQLLIADEMGKVVVQKSTMLGGGTDGLRIKHIDQLRFADATPQSAAALQRSTALLELRLAEEDFQLLCQPLRLGAVHAGDPGSGTAEDQQPREATWVVCGLVPAGLASSESSLWTALAVSPTLLLVLVLLFFIGLLAWPFIKLFAMSRRERLRFADVYFLSVSTFGILILTTILLVDSDSYFRLQGASFEGLRDLAVQVERHIMDELAELYDQLDAYDRDLSEKFKDQHLSQCELLEDTFMLADTEKGSGSTLDLGRPMELSGEIYPYFASVFWMGPEDGRQFIKGTIWEQNTPAVELKRRPYFSAVVRGRLWSVGSEGWCREERDGLCQAVDTPGPRDARKRCFYVQSFRSITTGERSAALSKWSCLSGTLKEPEPELEAFDPDINRIESEPVSTVEDADEDCGDKNGTVGAAISGRLVSVTDPVLAPGYGFAVIESNGRVLFHSDNRRILEENLFQEVRNSRRLRSAVISRTERMMTSTYLSRPHQLVVKPFRDLPWSIVTFADKELLYTAHLESLAHAVILSIGYLLCYFFFTLIYLLFTGKRTSWLWPDRSKESVYRRLTLLFVVLLVVFALGLHFLRASTYPMLCFTFPAVSVALAALLFRRRNASEGSSSAPAAGGRLRGRWGPVFGKISDLRWIPLPKRWRDDSFLLWHYAAAVLLWFLIAILPAYGFYKLAFNEQQRLLLKVENLHVADRLEERACAIADYYAPIASGLRPAVPRDFLRKRRSLERHDVYLSTLFAPPGDGTRVGSSRHDEVRRRLEKRRDWVTRVIRQDQKAWNDFDSLTPSRWLARFKPLYNETATQLRYLQPAAADDDAWTWKEDGEIVVFSRRTSECGEPVHLLSALPVPSPILGVSTWIGGVLMTLFLLAWVRYSARFLYFARIAGQLKPFKAEALVRGELETNMIALIVSPRDRKAILQSPHYERISLDVGEATGERGAEMASGREKPPIACEHFEYGLGEATSRLQKLRLLERLVFDLRRRVLILSSIDPFEKLCRIEMLDGEAEPAEALSENRSIHIEEDEARRWVHLLSQFVLMPVMLAPAEVPTEQVPAPDPGAAPTEPEINTAFVRHEIDTSHHFQRLVRDHLDTPGIDRREALERILETAGGYYRWLWTACSEGEKLVLVQLAEEGFVNPKQARTVRRLLQRGLVVRDPVLRLMSPSFALFVDRIHAPEDVARWEEPTRGLGWTNLRWAFLALLAVIIVFLSATQKQLLETTLGFASALAVAVPGILRLLSVLHRGSIGASAQGE